jgi:RNA-directed DNA polymerase
VITHLAPFTRMVGEQPQRRLTALMGLLADPQGLRESFKRQNGRKAPGVDLGGEQTRGPEHE